MFWGKWSISAYILIYMKKDTVSTEVLFTYFKVSEDLHISTCTEAVTVTESYYRTLLHDAT